MSDTPVTYDVMFLHVHKQHIYESIAGAVEAGLKTAFVTPLYNRGLTRIFFGMMPNRVGRMVCEHEDPRLSRADIHTGFQWSLARLFVNYAWHRGDSRFFRIFDHWCARQIRFGRFRAKIFYVFQDYLPRTCLAAKDTGSLLVAEQIINNSPKAQERVLGSTGKVSFPVKCPEYPLDQSVNEQLLRLADGVVVPCSYVRDDIGGEVAAGKIWEAPYGAPETAQVGTPGYRVPASHAPSKAGAPVLIAARANTVRKGGHLLIEAFLSHSAEDLFPGYSGQVNVRLLGNIDSQFLPAIDRIHALQPRIRITHGFIPHSLVAAALAQADFFILPSLSESTSLAMLEAAAAGLPLVITPFCGLDDFVNGTHGILIADTTPAAIAQAIREMFLRRTQWTDFGRNAQKIVSVNSWREFSRRIGANLRSLLA